MEEEVRRNQKKTKKLRKSAGRAPQGRSAPLGDPQKGQKDQTPTLRAGKGLGKGQKNSYYFEEDWEGASERAKKPISRAGKGLGKDGAPQARRLRKGQRARA